MSEPLELGDWAYFLLVISYLFVVISFGFCVYATYRGVQEYQIKKRSGEDPKTLNSWKMTLILTITCMWIFTAMYVSII